MAILEIRSAQPYLALVKMRRSQDVKSPTVRSGGMRAPESVTPVPDPLMDFPYLRAALEDLQVAQRYASTDQPNRRHVICLMIDALEFI